MESELIVEYIAYFSMFAWPSFSSKAVIVCGRNAWFEFRNINAVTVSGLEFIGCFKNHVISVGQFQLESSSFLGNGYGHAIANGTVLSIDDSTANLDEVVFISIIDEQLSVLQEISENCTATTVIE